MAKMYVGQIPFYGGDQLHYPEHNCSWRQNFTFRGALRVREVQRGRSAAYFLADITGPELPGSVIIFMTDLLDMLPRMTRGVVRGEFTFCKRGQNYGCKLVAA